MRQSWLRKPRKLENLSSQSGDQKTLEAPFPFDTTVNVISYMSCPTADKFKGQGGPYYTFRVGAYDNVAYNLMTKAIRSRGTPTLADMSTSGISLSPSYLEYMDKNFKVGTEAPAEALQSIISQHPNYKDTKIQLNFRSKNDLIGLMSYPGSTEAIGVTLLDTLSLPAYSANLSKARAAILNSFPAQAENKRNLSASLFFNTTGEDQNNIRNDIQQNYFLSLSYEKQSPDGFNGNAYAPLQLDANDRMRIYGRGFAVNFAKPNSIPPSVEAAANANLAIRY